MKNKVKVIFPYMGNSIGGSYVSSSLIVKELYHSDNFNVKVYFPKKGVNDQLFLNFGLEPSYYKFPTKYIKKLHNTSGVVRKISAIYAFYKAYRTSIKILKKEKPDIVHINDDRTMNIWGLAAKKLKIPVVWHIRQEKGNRIADKIRMYCADYLLFVAYQNKNRFKSFRKVKPNKVIHNGVNLQIFNPPNDKNIYKNKIGITKDELVIGFIGNLVARKRPEWFVESGIEILKKGFKAKFVLIGEDQEDYINLFKSRIKSENLMQNFMFLGLRNDVPDLMKALDILVLTSVPQGEAFPRVIIEAMATSVPVISTNIAGVSEAVDNNINGLLVDPLKKDELIDKLLYLINNDSLRLELAKNAYSKGIQFSSKEKAEEILNFYKLII